MTSSQAQDPDPGADSVTITRFRTIRARTGSRDKTTWLEFFALLQKPIRIGQEDGSCGGRAVPSKKDLPAWSPATFRDDRRLTSHCEAIHALVLDYDGGTALDTAMQLWSGHFGFVQTTPSHRRDGNGDRFRVILPFRRAVTPDEYPRIWRWALAKVKRAGQTIDGSTKDVARIWYMPGCAADAPFEAKPLDGAVLDPDEILAESAQALLPSPAPKTSAPKPPASAAAMVQEGKRHNTVLHHLARLRARGVEGARLRDEALSFNARSCSPPLSHEEVEDILHWVESRPRSYPLTDAGNAERFVLHHGRDLRFCVSSKSWYRWDRARWMRASSEEVLGLAKGTSRSIAAEAADAPDEAGRNKVLRWAMGSESRRRLEAMVALAKAEQDVLLPKIEFDSDAWLLACANGVLDLRTAELRPARREDRITKQTGAAYDPQAHAQRFERFLAEILPDPEVRAFVQRWAGYALTGAIQGHHLVVLLGRGRNGKSTLINCLLRVLGDYGRSLPPDLLVSGRKDHHPTVWMTLRGARLAVAMEAEAGQRFDESTLKLLTGGDRVVARPMFENYQEFAPTHKLVLCTNVFPKVGLGGRALWERILVVPFEQTFTGEREDRTLQAALDSETEGIFRWMVEGCRSWGERGLDPPAAVRRATAAERARVDPVWAFVEERCIQAPEAVTPSADLYASYVAWAKDNPEPAMDVKRLGRRLTDLGFETCKGSQGRRKRRGLALKSGDPY